MKAPFAIVAGACIATGLLAPAVSHAEVVDVYVRLAEQKLTPAPLVPASVPRAVQPVGENVREIQLAGGYGLSFFKEDADGESIANVIVTGGEIKRLSSEIKTARKARAKVTKTRVRGHSGYVITTRPPRRALRYIVWRENRVVYAVATETPKMVSLASLKSTAAALEPLGPVFEGNVDDRERDQHGSVIAATTTGTVSVRAGWSGRCVGPRPIGDEFYNGAAIATWVPRAPDGTFGFDIAGRLHETPWPWTGNVTGNVAAGAPMAQITAAGVFEQRQCNIDLSFPLLPPEDVR